ncbi:hypothetical protein ACI8AC_24160 [Geodermatophilus sp. SYSU D00758]
MANDGEGEQRGPTGRDPRLDNLRVEPTGNCWWCGAKADSQEHRFKHSSLRRVAGGKDPRNVFKKSDNFEGVLRSIKSGSQVLWPKNFCQNCNNARSQPFDLAYDVFEDFLFRNGHKMGRWERLSWPDIFGGEWREGATNLARYFGKQVGCMLSGQDLPVPEDLITFLNGAERCPSVRFMLLRNWRAVIADSTMRRHSAVEDGLMTFIGLLESNAYASDGVLSGHDYGYHIGYIWVTAQWRMGTDRSSWFECPSIELPLINGSPRDRLRWLPHHLDMEYRHYSARVREYLSRRKS